MKLVAFALMLCCLGCAQKVDKEVQDGNYIQAYEISIVEKGGHRFAIYVGNECVTMVLLPNDKKGSNE